MSIDTIPKEALAEVERLYRQLPFPNGTPQSVEIPLTVDFNVSFHTEVVQDTIAVADDINFDTELAQAKINMCSVYVDKSEDINLKLQELAAKIMIIAKDNQEDELAIWAYLGNLPGETIATV